MPCAQRPHFRSTVTPPEKPGPQTCWTWVRFPHLLTQLGHYVLDHERFPGARGEDVFPGLEDELGRGVTRVPLLQGAGQLATDGGVERLQARLHEGQPRVDPRVDGDGVRQRVPVFHLQEGRERAVHTACGAVTDALRGSQRGGRVLS